MEGRSLVIQIERYEVNGLPYLEIVKEELKNKVLPTVFFYHGWTNCKESVLVNGYEVAQQNIRAIIPDAMFHGERSDGQPITEHFDDFANIVMASIDEFAVLMEDLVNRKVTDKDRIGVTGLSMGGITTCGIMATYPEVKAGDCLMGAPNFHDFVEIVAKEAFELEELPKELATDFLRMKEYDLSLKPEVINGRAFHFWHGLKDDMVPYQPTFDFYEEHRDTPYGKQMSFNTTNDGHRVPYSITLEMASFFANVL